jgi:predicted N-acetyltransferase YhbS
MAARDLAAIQALSVAVRWPHRVTDWEQAFRHGEGLVAECDGEVIGSAARFLWGERHATVGMIIVAPDRQGQGIGQRLMDALMAPLAKRNVLLHATVEGTRLYERMGFVRVGETRQYQGIAPSVPPVALGSGARLRPAMAADRQDLIDLDAQGRGMSRGNLIADLMQCAQAAIVLDDGGQARGFALLRSFGRGQLIGPVVAGDETEAKALIAHLLGLNAGRFTRIDVDADTDLGVWLEGLGLACVDSAAIMVRGAAPTSTGKLRWFATATQALG